MIMEPASATYALFDLSGSALTSFNLDDAKVSSVDALVQTRPARSHSRDAAFDSAKCSTVADDDSEGELGALSNAGTCSHCEQPAEGSVEAEDDDDDDSDSVTDLLHVETVRQKIEVLAAMVGMEESDEPGAVLGEVVKVLKELERKAEGVACRMETTEE
ncbi:hypothetical protein B296_00033338 [Ensete ventricosum]|uniref:Uncharacterized protein n=1 Tax=Ensete ventricosum TaxID=4639 RepID=A0A426XWG4_ENSVE|nr:hypothetical protein B296_00033338 [Ensete ventricosum]